MEAFQTARTNLFDSFNREFYTLEKSLSEELTRRTYKSCLPILEYKNPMLPRRIRRGDA